MRLNSFIIAERYWCFSCLLSQDSSSFELNCNFLQTGLELLPQALHIPCNYSILFIASWKILKRIFCFSSSFWILSKSLILCRLNHTDNITLLLWCLFLQNTSVIIDIHLNLYLLSSSLYYMDRHSLFEKFRKTTRR